MVLGGVVVAGFLCGGWVFFQTVRGLLADFAFLIVPAGAMAAVGVAAVIGWKTGLLRRWSRTRVAMVTLALVLLALVALAGGWIVRGTLDAGRGAPCPQCAVDEYVWAVLNDPPRLRNFLCADRRDELAAEADAWRGSYRAALDRWALVARLDVAAADDQVNDKTATVSMPVQHTHEHRWQDGGGVASRKQLSWRFDVVDDGGWRVCRVELPDVCAQVILCGGPESVKPSMAPTPSPSFRPWSQWDERVRWECFPDAGVWQRPGCASPPNDWSQPGPHYCAPSFPRMLRDPQKAAHCRELGWNVA